MEYPLISVLIPTYNVEAFVSEAINSILNQTYRNLEIIIVDDGSTDNTYEILEDLAKLDSRIKLFKNEYNQRIVNTLNFAFKKSSGQFIARMDGDDISLPNRIETQFLYLQQKKNVSLVGLNIIMIDEDGNEIHKENYLTNFDNIKKAIQFASPVNHVWLAKREVYEKVGAYRIPTAEDYDFIWRAIDLGYVVNNAPDFLYLQRIRGGNTATSSGLIQRKSIEFVKKMHQERLLNFSDSFSVDKLNDYLKVNVFEDYMFKLSSKFHFKYVDFKNKSLTIAIFYRLMSVMCAPKKQIRHIYKRWRYKRIIAQS